MLFYRCLIFISVVLLLCGVSDLWMNFLYRSMLRSILYDLIDVLSPFSVILQPMNFFKVEFANNSNAHEIAGTIAKYFDFSSLI